MSRKQATIVAANIEALERLSIGNFLSDAEGQRCAKRIRKYAQDSGLEIEKAGWRSYRVWYRDSKGERRSVKAGLGS